MKQLYIGLGLAFLRFILFGIIALQISSLVYGEESTTPTPQKQSPGIQFSEVFLRHRWNQWPDSSEVRFSGNLSGNRLVLDFDTTGKPQALSLSNSYLRIGKLDLGTDFRNLANPLGLPLGLSQIPTIPIRPIVVPTDVPNLGVAFTLVSQGSSLGTLASSLGILQNQEEVELYSLNQGSIFFSKSKLSLGGIVWFWQRWLDSGTLTSNIAGVRVSLEQAHRKIPWFLWLSAGAPSLEKGLWFGSGIGGRFGTIPRSVPKKGALQYRIHVWTQGVTHPLEGITRRVVEERSQVIIHQSFDLRSKLVQLQPIVQFRMDSSAQSLTLDWLMSMLLTRSDLGHQLKIKSEARGITENLKDVVTGDWWFNQLRFGLETTFDVELHLFQLTLLADHRFLVEPGKQSWEDTSVSGDLPKAKDFIAGYGVKLANQGTKVGWSILGKVEILGSPREILGLQPSFQVKWDVPLSNKAGTMSKELLSFEITYKMNQAMEPNWFRGINPTFFLNSPGKKLGIIEFQWSLSSKIVN